MNDLRTMTALELLRFEAAQENRRRGLGAHTLLAFERAGISDLDAIYADREHNNIEGIFELTKDGRRVEPPLTADDIETLALVGVAVYVEDRENVAEWLHVARRWLDVCEQFPYYVRSQEPRKIIAPFLAAGRGPSYVRRVLESAVAHRISPHAYGFDLSADDWDRLASAGVADRAALAGYTVAGCTMTQAVEFAAQGVPPGAAVLLWREGAPMTSWVERAAGIPAEWVPYGPDRDDGFHDDDKRSRDPIKDGIIGKGGGHTLDSLKRYADAGWAGQRVYDFGERGCRFGHGRRSGGHITLTRALCLALVDAGLDVDDLKRWASAVTTSSAGSRTDRDYVPALFEWSWKDDMLADVIRLHEAGVRPSHINDYRYAGCRSAADVLRCVEAGINGTRVAYLRKTYAKRRNQWDKDRMTLRELLAAHETDKQEAAK